MDDNLRPTKKIKRDKNHRGTLKLSIGQCDTSEKYGHNYLECERCNIQKSLRCFIIGCPCKGAAFLFPVLERESLYSHQLEGHVSSVRVYVNRPGRAIEAVERSMKKNSYILNNTFSRSREIKKRRKIINRVKLINMKPNVNDEVVVNSTVIQNNTIVDETKQAVSMTAIADGQLSFLSNTNEDDELLFLYGEQFGGSLFNNSVNDGETDIIDELLRDSYLGY